MESRPGIAILAVEGKKAAEAFAHEPGGHRWQGDSGGRVHTSTITVAVLREPTPAELRLDDRDLSWSTCRGSGAGGQHRNKTESAVVVKHLPTGTTVRCESERSQLQNKATALGLLRARLLAATEATEASALRRERRGQIGCGDRSDKVRTYREQDGVVTDHRSGRKVALDRVVRGHLEDFE